MNSTTNLLENQERSQNEKTDKKGAVDHMTERQMRQNLAK